MIKILMIKTVSTWYEGITNVISNIVDNLDPAEFVVDSVVISEPTAEYVEMLKRKNGTVFVINRSVTHPLQYMHKLIRIIKQGNYDIVHAHGNSHTLALEMVAARRAGCKVRIAHSHNTFTKYALAHKLLGPVFNMSYTDGFACSEEAGKWLFGNRSFSVLNNAIDLDKFVFSKQKRQEYRQKLGVVEDDVLVGQVGSLAERKNPLFSVDILSRLKRLDKHYKLIFVGGGLLQKEIEDKAKKFLISDSVMITGQVSNDIVSHFLSAMDALVFPSHIEGFGIVAVEAQCSGLPVIAADHLPGAIKVTDSLTFLPLDSPEKWVEQLYKIDRSDRASRSERNRTELEMTGYSIKMEIDKLSAFYTASIKH